MFGYYLRLAFRNLRRNPGLTALMIGAVALGIAVCVMTLTMYRAMSGNPIWWKNDVLYAVTIDSWDPQQPYDEDKPELPPAQLTYRDAMALYRVRHPEAQGDHVQGRSASCRVDGQQVKPERVTTRVTTTDFFAMFDVPFQYGGGWTDAADDGPGARDRALAEDEREGSSAARTASARRMRWDDHEFRVVGVLDNWMPLPTFYDVNNGALEEPEDVYMPFGWNAALELGSAGNTNGWKPEDIKTYQDFLNSEMHLDPDVGRAAGRRRAASRFQAFLDNYAREQKQRGPLPAPAQQPPDERGPVADRQQGRRATTTACWSASPSPSSRCAW